MQKIIYSQAIALAVFNCTNYSLPVVAQQVMPASKLTNSKQLRYTPPPLPTSGTPVGRRRGAAGRGNCTLNQSLTALMPTINQPWGEAEVTYVWAKTSSEYPTFWFYVPDAGKSLATVEFVLQDEQDNDVYRTQVSLPEKPGIVSVRLPSTAIPLKINQKYHWFFKIASKDSCATPQGRLVKDSVEGWVQRVRPNSTLSSQLEAATPQQQIALYAANGLWYEAITSLAELRLLRPKDTVLQSDWNQLLQSVGLGDIASKPIIDCCSVNNYKQLSDAQEYLFF